MPKKPVSLSVHKNTVERRRKQKLSRDLSGYCRQLTRVADIRAFAVIAIDSDGGAHCNWDTGAIMPMWGFADTMASALRRDIEESGVDEDWKPSINHAPAKFEESK